MLRMKVLRIHLDRVWLHLNYVWDLVCLVLRPTILNILTKHFTKFYEVNLLFFNFLLFSRLKPLLGLSALFRLKLLVKKLYDFNFCLTVFFFWYLLNFCRLRLIQIKTPESRRVKVRLNAFWMNVIDNEVFRDFHFLFFLSLFKLLWLTPSFENKRRYLQSSLKIFNQFRVVSCLGFIESWSLVKYSFCEVFRCRATTTCNCMLDFALI